MAQYKSLKPFTLVVSGVDTLDIVLLKDSQLK